MGTFDEDVQRLAELLRAWAPTDKERHDAIELLSRIQADRMILRMEKESLEHELAELRERPYRK